MPHFMWKVGWHPQRLSASGKCNANKLRCYPQQLESFCVFAIKSAYAIKIKRLCHKKLSAYAIKKHWNPLEFHKASAPEPSGTSQGICTGTLRNLTKHLLRQNPPEPHKVSAPEPSGTSRYLPRNPPAPHHASSPRPSGTSSGTCTGNFQNLTRHLRQNPLESNRVFAL